jgi:hypothetical protein
MVFFFLGDSSVSAFLALPPSPPADSPLPGFFSSGFLSSGFFSPFVCAASPAAPWADSFGFPALDGVSAFGSKSFADPDPFSARVSAPADTLVVSWPWAFPNALRTICATSSSTELWAAFASIPFPCRKLSMSLLCLSSSLASSCTFIFAMLSSISAASGYFRF